MKSLFLTWVFALPLWWANQVLAGGSVTGGNTGDPIMAKVERSYGLAIGIIKNGDFFDGTFRGVDRSVARYIESSKDRLFEIASANELNWKFDGGAVCITRGSGSGFELEAHLMACKNNSKAMVAKQILAEVLKFNGLPQQTAEDYASKVMTAWEAMDTWKAKNIYRSNPNLSDMERKEVIYRGRLLAIETLGKLYAHSYPGGIVYPGQLTPKAKFVLTHKSELMRALQRSKLRWNWNVNQQSCAKLVIEGGFPVIDIHASLCREILSNEDAAELLVHEAVHAIGVSDELQAIRIARSVMGGWDAVP